MASKRSKKKRNKAAASSSGTVPQDNKTPKELKAKGNLSKKSSELNSAQMKEAEATPGSQSTNKEKNIKDGNQGNNFDKRDARKSLNINSGDKEKGSTSEMSVDVEKEGKTEKGVGGMIFMCNGKTKDDCFRYHVMGVSAMKKDIIMGIKPGLKLFLFDVDLKLMYGIYEASSAGRMKLEPAAFGGDYPAQVRFRIDKDCLPLPENLFKRAIKDNYNQWTHKFKTELTFKQVEQLEKLFRPVPQLRPTSEYFVSESVTLSPSAASLPRKEPSRGHAYGMQHSRSKAGENFSSYGHERENQQHAARHIMPREVDSHPRFLTEKEYRSYGLQSAKYFQPTASTVVDRTLDRREFEQGREHLRRSPTGVNSDAALARKETVQTDPLYPSEKEYRTYGLKTRSESSATGISAAPTNDGSLNHFKDTYNPYDERTTSLVNRYLSLPKSYSSAGPYSAIGIRDHTGRFHTENERAYPPTGRFHTENERYPPTGRFPTENEGAYPPYAPPQIPPEYGLNYHYVRDEPR